MNLLKNEAEKIGINLDEHKLKQFEIYMQYLTEFNSHTNLTSIKEPNDVLIKHFLDSIFVLKFIKMDGSSKVIDIGTGAGFPGVPIKICNPDLKITLLDSLNKRITFLKNLALKLGIEAEALHARAEEFGHSAKYREKFDFAVSRAVAPLNVLTEYCLPYVKVGGAFISLKGPDCEEEIKLASNAISTLGGVLEAVFHFDLPYEKGKRTIVVIRKKENISKQYPRKNSKISSAPL